MAAAPSTTQQWQGYVLKAQQGEAAAKEEARRLQQQLDRASARHVDELAEAQRAREELRGQLEVRQFALQHATDARDSATARAEAAERELSLQVGRLHDQLAVAEAERKKHQLAEVEAQAATAAALEQSRLHSERALEQEHRASVAERTIATLKFAVESLEVAKQQVAHARDAALHEVELERRRALVERGLLRSYASETEQQLPVYVGVAQGHQRETERVEVTLTTQIAAVEAAAEQQQEQNERTVAQLRGHIIELEQAVLEQQASHRHERDEADAAHAAELEQATSQRDASDAKSVLLSQQLNALAEAAQQIKAERAQALSGLAGTRAQLEETEQSLQMAKLAAQSAAQSEAEHRQSLDEVRKEVRVLGDQLSWLETCTKDAAEGSRPLLAATDAIPMLDADAAFREERARWSAGAVELHSTVTQLCETMAWLASELQSQLATSSAAGSAAAPAAELHEDLATQIAVAASGLPSSFAPAATFERARTSLVEAVRAQAQLASQSVAHLISCAADAEAVATLQAKQIQARHASTVTSMQTSAAVAVATLSSELSYSEETTAYATTLAWRHASGIVVHSSELREVEATLHVEASARVALEAELAALEQRLEVAGDAHSVLRTELTATHGELDASREREVMLETSLRHMGNEGRMNEDELLMAIRQAEESSAERAHVAAVAIADASSARGDASLEAIMLRNEIRDLEGQYGRACEDAAEAHRTCEAREGARAAAQLLYEREAQRSGELEGQLAATSASLRASQDECANATSSAQRHASETVEWAAKSSALEAMAAADARLAAGRQATLVAGMAELDETVKRATADLTTSRAQTDAVTVDLRAEEAVKLSVVEQLQALQEELDRRREAEEQARQEAERAKAAQAALKEASLRRELHALQQQLVYPRLTLNGPEEATPMNAGRDPWADNTSEALWANLLSDPSPAKLKMGTVPLETVRDYATSVPLSGAAAGSPGGLRRVPPPLSYAASDGDESELHQRVLAFASDADEIAPSAHAQHVRTQQRAIPAAAPTGAPPPASPPSRGRAGAK